MFLDAFGAVGSVAQPCLLGRYGQGVGQTAGSATSSMDDDKSTVSFGQGHDNDPSAGSPTETLLRLLLPLSDKVYLTFHATARSRRRSERFTGPLEIGRSDGRCVQRAGT